MKYSTEQYNVLLAIVFNTNNVHVASVGIVGKWTFTKTTRPLVPG